MVDGLVGRKVIDVFVVGIMVLVGGSIMNVVLVLVNVGVDVDFILVVVVFVIVTEVLAVSVVEV